MSEAIELRRIKGFEFRVPGGRAKEARVPREVLAGRLELSEGNLNRLANRHVEKLKELGDLDLFHGDSIRRGRPAVTPQHRSFNRQQTLYLIAKAETAPAPATRS